MTRRGIDALDRVDLVEAVLDETVAVEGRMMHDLDGELTYQPYGTDASHRNYSISRSGLNRLLLGAAERAGAHLHFGRSIEAADLAAGHLRLDDGESIEGDVIFGTDGAGSVVRRALVEASGGTDTIEWLGVDYKELVIPPADDGGFRVESNALHIWPRGRQMLMALPNIDGSFTVTLYLPSEGESSFQGLESATDVQRFFESFYRDAIELIPCLEEDFLANPVGRLGTVRCRPWHLADRAVLLGDAAHAIVPFFGQGMNAGFEDCVVLDRLLDECPDRAEAFSRYTDLHGPNGDAIADMAIENYSEMSDRVGDPAFLLRKEVERELARAFPGRYESRYNLVVHGLGTYREAFERGLANQALLDELCRGLDSVQGLDLQRAAELLDRSGL